MLLCPSRRAPHVGVVVYPSLVQGADAPASLVRAIEQASQRAEVQVLIVCRGGGSLEDLWSFNDERVVRAIAGCAVPVVSGVGHETDVTLADLAADLRAPTPTAAAELAAPVRQDCLDALEHAARALQRRVRAVLDMQDQRLDRIALRLSRPGQGLQQHAQRLDRLAQRLGVLLPRSLQVQHALLAQRRGELDHQLAMRLADHERRVQRLSDRLQALDPRRVLARGYAWLSDPCDRPIASVGAIAAGQTLQVVLHDGRADMQVLRVHTGQEA